MILTLVHISRSIKKKQAKLYAHHSRRVRETPQEISMLFFFALARDKYSLVRILIDQVSCRLTKTLFFFCSRWVSSVSETGEFLIIVRPCTVHGKNVSPGIVQLSRPSQKLLHLQYSWLTTWNWELDFEKKKKNRLRNSSKFGHVFFFLPLLFFANTMGPLNLSDRCLPAEFGSALIDTRRCSI